MEDSNVSFAAPIDIPLERSLYVGNILRSILYGSEIFTFFAAVYCISQRPPDYRKRQIFYVIYGGTLLSLTTIEMALDALWGQYMWIDHRNHPGGPLGFFQVSQNVWYVASAFGAGVMANILGDGLLLYRCFIIWDSQWRIVAFPALIYLASSGLSIVTLVECAVPRASLLKGKPIQLAVPWASLSVSLNIILTSMICFRLLRMRALMRDVVLDPEMSRMYTSIAAMLIESAAPFSVLGIGLVVAAARMGPLIFAFGYVWTTFCSFSPQLIILRVAMGRGLVKETVYEFSTALAFAEQSTVHEHSQTVCVTISDTEGTIYRPGTPASTSEKSTRKRTSVTGDIFVRHP